MESIILPKNFRRSRYSGGYWLDTRLQWKAEDIKLLTAAVDLRIDYTRAANTLGRKPSSIAYKARDLGLDVPALWKLLIRKTKKKEPKINLQYPYIIKPDDKHSDLIAVNRMVSKAMPGREDVCQDIMLALWESRTSLQELSNDPAAVKSFVKSFRRQCFERSGYGVESMDVTIYGDDGGNKIENAKYNKSLINHDDQFIEDQILGGRNTGYTANFSEQLIEEITRDEKELGVPACFWMRADLRE